MPVRFDGETAATTAAFTSPSTFGDIRRCFIQVRTNNAWVSVDGGTTKTYFAADSTGVVYDLGDCVPSSVVVQSLSGTSNVSMFTLPPGEAR